MPVNMRLPQAVDIHPVPGVTMGIAQAGIRKKDRDDLLVICLAPGSEVAGVFTQNRFCAAPVQICQEHLHRPATAKQGGIRALVVNTGCANAGTGTQGLRSARDTCQALAELLGLSAHQVLPFSTGVIMEPLPMPRLLASLPMALQSLSADRWLDAARAIMTTDTQPKAVSRTLSWGGQSVTISGIAKGAGMIHPNMATMLGFIATDVRIPTALLQSVVREVADSSFNAITIDGDTSTNDSFILIATGQSTAPAISTWDDDWGRALKTAITEVAIELAQAIVRDGEGATKFITIRVVGGRDQQECRQVATAIAHSPLVKTAFFASDPNLGRILAAVGYAGIHDLDVNRVSLHLDDVLVAVEGGRAPQYQEADGQRVMKQSEITVRIDLQRGSAQDCLWTCDLSHDYVSINADYRS